MRKSYLSFLLLLLTFNLSSTVFAETFHVAADGNDAKSGSSIEDAWKTVDRGQPTVLTAASKSGDTELIILKANQFPKSGKVLIKGVEVSYTGRSFQKLTGCANVPSAAAEEKVTSVDYKPAGAGDTIIVGKGVYFIPFDSTPTGGGRFGLSVAMFFSGGEEKAPLKIIGKGLPVLDACEEDGMSSLSLWGDFIEFSGFDVRRGGISVRHAQGIKITDCRVHEGKRAISAYKAKELDVIGNMIYDMRGAWGEHGVVLTECSKTRVLRNTIVSNEYAIRVRGGDGIEVKNNLIAWCRKGIINEKTEASELKISGNNIWWVGHGIWLQRDDNNDVKKTRYVDCLPGKGDFSADPLIGQWNPAYADFLYPLKTSPCVENGKVIVGAGNVAEAYPAVTVKPTVVNPSFESGLLGWKVETWEPFTSGQAGWKIVSEPGNEGGKCLELFDFPSSGKRIAVRIRSSSFRYTRGKALVITFKAKGEKDGTSMSAGMTLPFWQNKSSIGENVSLSQKWKSYSVRLIPLARFPDYAEVTFTTSSNSRCWIDSVSIREEDLAKSEPKTVPSVDADSLLPKFEFVADDTPGMLLPLGKPLTGRIINRSGAAVEGALEWTLESPLRGIIATGTMPFKSDLEGEQISIPFKQKTSGIFLLRYRFTSAGKDLSSGKLRFSIGTSAKGRRNSSFFAATPPWENMISGELLDKQIESLAALGIGTLHLYISYKKLNKMMYDSRMDDIFEVTEKHGLDWMFTPSDAAALTGESTWAPAPGNVGPDAIELKRDDLKGERCSEAQLKAWATAIGLLVEKYQGRIKFYEILNEPNTFLDGEEYKKVLTLTSEVIRRLDPKATIIGGSVVNAQGQDLWNATMSTPPGTFDLFSYHPYRFGLPNPERKDESFRRDLLSCKEDLIKNGHKPLVFLTEEGMGPGLNETRSIGFRLGYSGYPRLVDFHQGEILQANYGARMFLTALAEGGAGYSYHTLGNMITDSMMNPMLILKSIHTMNTMVGDAEPLGRLKIGHDFVCYLFKKSSGEIAAGLWMKDAEYALPVAVTLPAKSVSGAVDAFGFNLPRSKSGKSDENIVIDRSITYLIFDKTQELDSVKSILKGTFQEIRTAPGPQPTGE